MWCSRNKVNDIWFFENIADQVSQSETSLQENSNRRQQQKRHLRRPGAKGRFRVVLKIFLFGVSTRPRNRVDGEAVRRCLS